MIPSLSLLLASLLFLIPYWAQHATVLALPTSDTQLAVIHEHQLYDTPGSSLSERDDAIQDPNDQSWITSWAAVGDSYSAGIGCGYILHSACARYNYSWPNLINNDARMGETSKEFQFLACSGATSPEILANQIPQISDGVQVITMTAGGNDAGFSDILIDCIYGVNPNSKCDFLLENAQRFMQSDEFTQSIKKLLSAAISKLGDNGRVYYVGYAPFFDVESTQCNDVSWDVFGLDFIYTKLTTDLRTRINALVSQMNAVLDGIVRSAGDQAVFVDYSVWVEKVGGRFCEEDIQEPSGNNRDLFFYEWSTVDEWESFDFLSMLQDRSLDSYSNTTLAGKMASAVAAAQAENSTLKVRNIYADDTEPADLGSLPSDLNKRNAAFLDGIKRVFHPTLNGHSLIANLVLYHMGVERAKMFKQQVEPLIGQVLPSSCAPDQGYKDGGPVVPSDVKCTAIPDNPDNYWFDTDTIRQIQNHFCKYVQTKNTVDIAQSTSEDNGLGKSYAYQVLGAYHTYINIWVQNAGCRRPSLYSSERTCRALTSAIVNQCNPESTKKFGGSAAFSCEEFHIEVAGRFTKFSKNIQSWNGTWANSTGLGLQMSELTFVRTETNDTQI